MPGTELFGKEEKKEINDVLETGMVFNIEPAIYIEGYGGMRHCDMVAVGTSGAEILTDFQRTPAEMVIIK